MAGTSRRHRRMLTMRQAFAFCVLAAAATAGATEPRDQLLALTHVTVVDVEGSRKVPDSTLLFSPSNGRIVAVGPSASTKLPKGTRVIDASRGYVIPGLWDMHVHALRPETESYLPMFISNGVTGVRDMGTGLGNLPLAARWRQGALEGRRIGPRIYASGPVLGAARPQNAIPSSTEAEARLAVTTLKQKGADFIKVYSLLPAAAFFAALDEAARNGLDVVGHVPVWVTAEAASDGGQKSMEHLYGILESCSTREADVREEIERAATNADTWAAWGAVVRATDRLYARQEKDGTYSRERCASLFSRFVRNRTWQCPTLVLRRAFTLRDDPQFTDDPRTRELPPSVVAAWKNSQADTRNRDLTTDEFQDRRLRLEKESALVGEMQRAGVGLLAGTDLGNPYVYPGSSLHDELAMLVQAGLTPVEALRTATTNPVRFLKLTDSLGSVAEGKLADLVVLDGDPLTDIANTRRIRAVIFNGRYFTRAELNAKPDPTAEH